MTLDHWPIATASLKSPCHSVGQGRSALYLERLSSPHFFAACRHQGHTRMFSNSAPIRATIILQNPRVDDDGNEMIIEISDRAAKVGDGVLHGCFC